MQKPFKNGLILGLFTLICISAVSITYHFTAAKIAEEAQAEFDEMLNQIVPNDIYETKKIVTCPSKKGVPNLRALMYKNNNVVALALDTVAPDGYSGAIEIIIGVTPKGEILGVRTVKHDETPGLGDKIDIKLSNWVTKFTGLSIDNPKIEKWKVKKDGGNFDQFTGATVTPRAYVKSVKKALLYFNTNKENLLKNNCEDL